MPATLKIDQAGLPAGTPGFARTDGLDTGALVTLTSTGGGFTHAFRLLWVPPADVNAVASLTQTSPTTATFSPTAAVYGSYRIELVVDEGLASESREIKVFAIRTPNLSLLIPSANEVANPAASLLNDTAQTIASCDQNEAFGPFTSGSSWGWYRALDEALTALDGAASSVTIGPSNCLFVDVNGNDGTAVRGNAQFPFATLGAAVAAALDGDQIRLGPGTFLIDAALAFPAGTDRLSIVGSGSTMTQIVGVAPLAGPVIQPPPTMRRLEIKDCAITNTVAFDTVVTDATGSGGTFYLDLGFLLQNVYLNSITGVSLSVTHASNVIIENVILAEGALFQTCRVTRCVGLKAGTATTVSWDNDDADKPGARMAWAPQSFVCASDLTLSEQAWVVLDGSCGVLGLVQGSSLSVATLANMTPRLECHGLVGGFDFSAGNALPDTAQVITWDLSGSTITDVISGGILIDVAAPAANRQSIKADGCSVPSGGAVVIGDGIDFFDRYADASSVMYSTPGTGTFTPGRWCYEVNFLGAGPQVEPFGFTATTVPDALLATNRGPVAMGYPAITATTVNDFTVDASGAGGGKIDCVLFWNAVY